MNIKLFLSILLKMMILGIIASITGILLLVISFLIPNQRIIENVNRSCSILALEGNYYNYMPGVSGAFIDNLADAIYINHAMVGNDGEGLLFNALGGFAYISKNDELSDIERRLSINYEEVTKGDTIDKVPSHIRYWNGYIVVLKLLFFFIGYPEIRELNIVLQTLLLVLLVLLMVKNKLNSYIIPFFISYLILNPISLSINILFSSMMYCAIIPCIFVLLLHRYLNNNSILIFFEIVGICVAYFNMNIFQLITWGMPILFLLIMDNTTTNNYSSKYKRFILSFLGWCFGYAGMVISKWICTALLTDISFKENIISTIKLRLSSSNVTGEEIARNQSIIKNFQTLYSNHVLILFEVVFLIIIFVYMIIHRYKIDKIEFVFWIIIFLVTTSIVLLRYYIFSNHSYIHYNYIFRNFMLSMMCLNFGVISMIKGGIPDTNKVV